jgi:hypothetical protein
MGQIADFARGDKRKLAAEKVTDFESKRGRRAGSEAAGRGMGYAVALAGARHKGWTEE